MVVIVLVTVMERALLHVVGYVTVAKLVVKADVCVIATHNVGIIVIQHVLDTQDDNKQLHL